VTLDRQEQYQMQVMQVVLWLVIRIRREILPRRILSSSRMRVETMAPAVEMVPAMEVIPVMGVIPGMVPAAVQTRMPARKMTAVA
jgi:hypothetical protein